MIKKFDIVAFSAGLATLLFIPTPLGRIALFELASYALAILILLSGGYKYFNKLQRRIILFSLLWLVSTILTDLIRGEGQFTLIKSSLVVLSVPCVLIVAFSFLRRKKFSFLWYIVGYGISGIASLYIFHNGAFLFYAGSTSNFAFFDITRYLIPKQYMPFYVNGITYGLLFPLNVFYGLPILLMSLMFSLGSAQMLFVGSRLHFLTYSLTAIFILGLLFSKKFLRKTFKNPIMIILMIVPILYVIFEIYAYTAGEGILGESERQKFENQVLYSEYGAVGGRESSIETAKYAILHPFIGTGSSRINQDNPHERVSGHSIIFGAWAINGFGGLLFWAYVIFILVQFGKKFDLIDKRWLPFIMFIIVETFWHILFSPFGYYRGFICVVIAYGSLELTRFNVRTNTKYLNNN